MPLSTDIYSALPRPMSVADYDLQAANVDNAKTGMQANKLALLLNQQKADEYSRGIADDNALRGVVKSFGPDQSANVASLFKAGRLKEGQAYQKALDESKQTAAKTSKELAGAMADIGKNYRDQLTMVQTPEQAAQWLKAQYADPVFGLHMQSLGPFEKSVTTIPSDPAAFAQWQQKAGMGMDRFIADQTQRRGQDVTMATNAATNARMAAEGAANRGMQMRGQDLTDARTRENTAATLTKPFEVTGPDGQPLLVQQDKKGNITPVEGFGPKTGSSKPLTDTQAKALLFGSRMQDADKILNNLSAKGIDMPSVAKRAAESVPGLGGALGALANSTIVSPDQQSVEQAQRDFVNAVLRRESGAAIAPSEFESAQKQYFPSVGDSAQVKKQKAANRSLAIKGLLVEVPAGQREAISKPAAAATGDIHSQAEAILRGSK